MRVPWTLHLIATVPLATVARRGHVHDTRYFTESEITGTKLAAGVTGSLIGASLS